MRGFIFAIDLVDGHDHLTVRVIDSDSLRRAQARRRRLLFRQCSVLGCWQLVRRHRQSVLLMWNLTDLITSLKSLSTHVRSNLTMLFNVGSHLEVASQFFNVFGFRVGILEFLERICSLWSERVACEAARSHITEQPNRFVLVERNDWGHEKNTLAEYYDG